MWSHEICIRLRGELEGGHLYIDPMPEEDGKDSSRSDMSCNPYSPLFFTKSTNESINYSIMCFFFVFVFGNTQKDRFCSDCLIVIYSLCDYVSASFNKMRGETWR